MDRVYDAAECIAALWRLSYGGENMLTVVAGIVDRAIEDVHSQLPVEIQPGVSFYDGILGRRCREWNSMQDWLLRTTLIEYDGASFTKIRVRVSREFCKQLLLEHGFSEAMLHDVPIAFYQAVKKHELEIS